MEDFSRKRPRWWYRQEVLFGGWAAGSQGLALEGCPGVELPALQWLGGLLPALFTALSPLLAVTATAEHQQGPEFYILYLITTLSVSWKDFHFCNLTKEHLGDIH